MEPPIWIKQLVYDMLQISAWALLTTYLVIVNKNNKPIWFLIMSLVCIGLLVFVKLSNDKDIKY